MDHPNESDIDISKIFVDDDGRPLRFTFHESIKVHGMQIRLKDDIKRNGGEYKDDDNDVDIVLCNEKRPGINRRAFQAAYNVHPDVNKRRIWVEHMDYVQRCIERGYRIKQDILQHRMPGIPPGSIKTPFTEEDVHHLCGYLAALVPIAEDGGRQGISLYSQMVETGDYVAELAWVKRHSAESWRTYYKKHKGRLDPEIEKLAERNVPNEKSMYIRNRRRNYHGPQVLDEDEEARADDAEEELAASQQSQAAPRLIATGPGSQRRTPGGKGKDKGKGRAADSDDDDHQTPNSLFDGPDSEGGEGEEQYPDDPSEFPAEPYFQRASSARIRPAPGTAHTSHNSPSSSRTRRGPAPVNPLRPNSYPERDENSSVPATPSQESQDNPHQEDTILVPSTSQISQPQAVRNSRKPRQPVALPTAPYRNTRSRSRSVEPELITAPRGKPRKKGGRSRTPSLEPEDVDENVLAPPTLDLETINEIDESDQFEVDIKPQPPLPIPSVPKPTRKRGREPSMDIDDRQIRQRLNRAAINAPLVANTGLVLRNIATPRLVTARERAPSPSTRSNSVPPLKQELANLPAGFIPTVQVPEAGPSRSRHRRQQSSAGFDSYQRTDSEVGRPGGRGGHERQFSDADSEQFPIPGTKAYEVIQRRKEQEKRTPYKPPAGSKAAEQSRTRARR